MLLIANIIHNLIQLFILVVIIKSILSWFMSPYDPVRQTVDRIVEPFLAPIRRLVPPAGMFDLSPIVLIVLLYLLDRLVIGLLLSLS